MGGIERKLYVFDFNSKSGITAYAKVFYDKIAKHCGFKQIDVCLLGTMIKALDIEDEIHFEIGVNEKKAQNLLIELLNRGFSKISVTLHDVPLIRYPATDSRVPIVQLWFKFLVKYSLISAAEMGLLSKLDKIFVLSEKGRSLLVSKGLSNVYKMNHVVDKFLKPVANVNQGKIDIVFFGFVAKNKGIDYLIRLFALLSSKSENIGILKIVGNVSCNNQESIIKLCQQHKVSSKIKFCGYVPDEHLKEVFTENAIVILPFQPYKFYYPLSGSILTALKYNTIVFTTNVNVVSELIQDGYNGVFLYNEIQKDSERLLALITDPIQMAKIKNSIFQWMGEYGDLEKIRNAFEQFKN